MVCDEPAPAPEVFESGTGLALGCGSSGSASSAPVVCAPPELDTTTPGATSSTFSDGDEPDVADSGVAADPAGLSDPAGASPDPLSTAVPVVGALEDSGVDADVESLAPLLVLPVSPGSAHAMPGIE